MSGGGLVKRQVGHRARLVLSRDQVAVLDAQAHAARALWNLLHDWWTMMPRCRRSLKAADVAIRQARKDIDWLAPLPAQAAQAVLKTYHRAWVNCWEGRAGAPNFKPRSRSGMAVDAPQGSALQIKRVHRRWGMVNIPKLGRVRFHWTRSLPVGKRADADNRITGARLIKDPLGWHITFRIQTLEPPPAPHTGPDVGIDVGVNIPLALSDDNHQDHGRPARLPEGRADRDIWLNTKEKSKLLRLERRAAHRRSFRRAGEGTSHRLTRTYDQIASLRARAKRRATDWQHQTTTALARRYGVIVVEQLDIANMVRSARGTVQRPGKNVAAKAGLNRSIGQQAWGRTVRFLGYKTAWHGGQLHKVPAPGTSLACHACGLTTPGSREDQATFVCKNTGCGWKGNADLNAARNILHLYRTGHALVPAAGRAVVRRPPRRQADHREVGRNLPSSNGRELQFYFSSKKKDVLLSLLDLVAEEADRAIVPRPPSPIADPEAFWRDVLTAFLGAFGSHREITATAEAARTSDPEIGALRSRLMTGWINLAAAIIAAERASGAAPDGPPARELATALSLMVERSMNALFTGQQPVVSQEHLVETLLHVVLGAVYGAPPNPLADFK